MINSPQSILAALFAAAAVSVCAAEKIAEKPIIPEGREAQYEMAQYIARRMSDFKKAHKNKPGPVKTVKWVYLFGNDQAPAEGYEERINEWVDTFDAYFDSEMKENFLPPCHPAVERTPDGKIKFHLIKGDKGKAAYSNDWMKCGYPMFEECRAKLNAAKTFDMNEETVCLVTNRLMNDKGEFAREGAEYADIHDKGGTAFLLDHPKLWIKNISSTEKHNLTDEYSRIYSVPTPLYDLVSYWVGNIPHEFLHAIGIQHNATLGAEAKRGIALMGMGTSHFLADRYQAHQPGKSRAVLTFADCARIISHPLFSGVNDGWGSECAISVQGFQVTADTASKTLTASGKITSSRNGEPYLALYYTDPGANPNDNWDSYTAPLWTGIVDGKGNFSVKVDLTQFDFTKRWRGRLIICMTNGNYINVPHTMFRGLKPEREIKPDFEAKQIHVWGDRL